MTAKLSFDLFQRGVSNMDTVPTPLFLLLPEPPEGYALAFPGGLLALFFQ